MLQGAKKRHKVSAPPTAASRLGGWRETLHTQINNTTPLRQLEAINPHAPRIVNIVSTVSILPQQKRRHYRLPLEAISMALGPCSQYAPVQFAANIIKAETSTTDSTILVFASGRLVLVSALTEMHSRYINQLFRVLIENVPCMLFDEETRTVHQGTLSGLTRFDNNVINNIVGHGDFGMPIDLRALQQAAPDACKYIPDSFPALQCSIWLTENNECVCSPPPPAEGRSGEERGGGEDDEDDAVNQLLETIVAPTTGGAPAPPPAEGRGAGKCACTIKCLIFSSGRIVLTGGRRVQDINAVFFRMNRIAPQFAQQQSAAAAPAAGGGGVFYERLTNMMVRKKRTNGITLPTAPRPSAGGEEAGGITPLMQFAEANRLEQVRQTLAFDPSQRDAVDAQGRTALERLQQQQQQQVVDPEIIKLLQA